MPEILHDLPIKAPAGRVFHAVTSPAGLDVWWTLRSHGEPVRGTEYELYFGPEYDWRAVVVEAIRQRSIAWKITKAEPDWVDTIVRFDLREEGDMTWVRFTHVGWREVSDHFRISSYCWAMYLRLLGRYVESGEVVPYANRLDA